ncbi:MAG: VanZ family protein [Bacteroidales bacterium]|nr:VanZ family protein [Bacteroidales bacterium]
MRSSIRYIIFPGLIALVIFYLTCIVDVDSIPVPERMFQYDKLVHFAMFFALSAAVFIDYYLKHGGKPNGYKWLLFGLVIPVIYGGLIEVAQENFFSRSGDWYDFIANSMGSMTATITALFYVYIKPKQ